MNMSYISKKYLPLIFSLGLFLLIGIRLEAGDSMHEKLLWECHFENGVPSGNCINNKAVIVEDASGRKTLRAGKNEDGRSSVKYKITQSTQETPFLMNAGKVEFRFRPVDWKIGDDGVNVLLNIAGKNDGVLCIRYIKVHGEPSIQAEYGQHNLQAPTKSKAGSIFMRIPLKGHANDNWHQVSLEWNRSELKLVVDGNMKTETTASLSARGMILNPDALTIGFMHENLTIGLTDMADIKITAFEQEALKKESTWRNFPMILLGRTPPPAIDGVVSSGEWAGAARVTGFNNVPGGKVSSHQPHLMIKDDGSKIYFCFQSQLNGKILKAENVGHDANIWDDDSIEIFLDPTPDTEDFFQVIINSRGVVFDQHSEPGRNHQERKKWDCSGIEIASKQDNGIWTTEIAMPYSAFSENPPGNAKKWLLNFCESRHGTGLFSLAGVMDSYSEKEAWGGLVFSGSKTATVNIESLGNLKNGSAEFSVGLDGEILGNGKAEISARRYDETAQCEFPLFSESSSVGNSIGKIFAADSGKLGKSGTIYLDVSNGSEKVYSGKLDYEMDSDVEIETMRVISKGDKKFLKIRTCQPLVLNAGNRLALFISDDKGKAVKHLEKEIDCEKMDLLIDITDLLPGDYTAGFKLFSADGKMIKEASPRSFICFGEIPPWKGNKLGISSQVPPPWIPLEAEEKDGKITVSCWNRKYVWSTKSLLPEALYSSGLNYLTNPMEIAVKNGGSQLQPGKITLKLLSKNEKSCEIEAFSEIEKLGKIICKATVEYDGFIWFDISVIPDSPVQISSLKILINMPENNSSLLNSGNRDLLNTGKTPEIFSKMLNDVFGPVWTGNEKGGLSIGVESCKDWSNNDESQQLTIIRKDSCRELSVNIIDTPCLLNSAMTYGFYIHPTPVRPRPVNYRKVRYYNWFGKNKSEKTGLFRYPVNFSWWMTTYEYQAFPSWVVDKEKIRETYEKQGRKYSPYDNYGGLKIPQVRSSWYAAYSSIGRNAPEIIWNGEKWRSGNTDKLYGNTLYGYYLDVIEMCKTADYVDFYLWRLDKSKKEHPEVDGLYFDLMFWPACTREDHHHGYIDRKGNRKPTWEIREHRKWLERIYTYIKEKDPASPIVMHLSGATSRIAGFSFCDYFADGELWVNEVREDRSYKRMKLEQFRAEALPQIYGQGFFWISQLNRIRNFIPREKLKDFRLEPWAMRHIGGILLLHDIIPDMPTLGHTALDIWKALDSFGLDDNDRYLPYWEKDNGMTVTGDEELAVSGFLKDKQRVMLIVFNNNDTAKNVNISADTEKLFGRNGDISVIDLETKQALHKGKNIFSIHVDARNFKIIMVTL